MCQFINILHMETNSPVTGPGPLSLLQCHVGKGTLLTYLHPITVFLGAKASACILWKLTQVFELLLFVWAIWESRLEGCEETRGSSWSHPIYFITSYVKQRVCVCSSLLMKFSGSGKAIGLNSVATVYSLSPI